MSRMSRSGGAELLRGVGRSLRGLIRAWWTIDRVRISPREGALLRLQPTHVIFVLGEPVEIVRREVDQVTAASKQENPSEQEKTTSVRYACCTAVGEASLSVCLAPGDRFPRLVWQAAGRELLLEEHQIEIYG